MRRQGDKCTLNTKGPAEEGLSLAGRARARAELGSSAGRRSGLVVHFNVRRPVSQPKPVFKPQPVSSVSPESLWFIQMVPACWTPNPNSAVQNLPSLPALHILPSFFPFSSFLSSFSLSLGAPSSAISSEADCFSVNT